MRNSCRHFNGIAADFRGEPMCAKGHDVRTLAGPEPGMASRLPCSWKAKNGEAFQCADLDRETDEEVAERRERHRKGTDLIMSAVPKIMLIKAEMIEAQCGYRTIDCLWCGAENSLHISVALQVNNHIHAQCEKCERRFRE